MPEAGYSGTPLAKKLGLKDGQAVAFVGLPDHLAELATARAFSAMERLPKWEAAKSGLYDLIHLFTKSLSTVTACIPGLRPHLHRDGTLWVSWPKKAAKVPTDVSEDVIRDTALAQGMVDVKVCAVDEVWSGLKLVIPVALRAAHNSEAIA